MQGVNEPQTLRPIEALTRSGSLLNRRIWLLLLPVGLDGVIWFAPRVIPGSGFLNFTEGLTTEEQGLFAFFEQLNILSLALGMWVPSLGVTLSGDGAGSVVQVESLSQLFLILALLLTVSFAAGSAYLALIAAAVQERTLTWETLALRVVRLAPRLAGLTGIVLVLNVIPIAVAGFITALAPPLGTLFMLLVLVLLFWIAFHAFYIVDSIALARQSLLTVMRLSLRLVHGNLWSAFVFFLVYWVIILLTSVFWNELIDLRIASLGLGRMVAVVGNAYVGTWLTIAVFLYVWNRILIHRGESSPAQTVPDIHSQRDPNGKEHS